MTQKLILTLKEYSPFQEGVMSETYQSPGKSYFQEPQELINTGKLVKKILLKQTDIDKILKIIERNASTCGCKGNTGRIFN